MDLVALIIKRLFYLLQLSAIKQWKNFKQEINPHALSELINYQSISTPNSIYKNIFQLLPGHVFRIDFLNSLCLENSKPWWSLTSTIEGLLKNQFLKNRKLYH